MSLSITVTLAKFSLNSKYAVVDNITVLKHECSYIV